MPEQVLSLGAGVQSSAILLMSYEGELPPLDYAIFADTGWEPKAVYEHLDELEARVGDRIPIHRVSVGNIRDDMLRSALHPEEGGRWAAPPLFVPGADGRAALLRRQCTKEYKIVPIYRELRKHSTREERRETTTVDLWMGISLDEVQRMRPAREPWVHNTYPLIEHRMSRWDCIRWLEARGLDAPKSACIGCPFHDNDRWRAMKRDAPEEFADAVAVDAAIRHLPKIKAESAYLHRDLVPLDMVDLSTPEDHGQQVFGWDNECDGICAV
jgi:hypothetical protein